MLSDFPFPDIPQLSAEFNTFLKWFSILVVFYLIVNVVDLTLKIVVHIDHIYRAYYRVASRRTEVHSASEEEQQFVI